jgi:DNA-binding LacI/PurR family transcriptional regulator/signal transduction histidine kinase
MAVATTVAGGSRVRDSGRPPRLGVFIGFLDDTFQSAIWRSIVSRAGERGAEVIGFSGHGLGAPLPSQSTMNISYRLAGPSNIDACIVLSNTIGNFGGPECVAKLISSSSLPTVSIDFDFDGIPSVCAHGGEAMSELVRHLVRDHGKTRLALVTGPSTHLDSIEREAAFRKVLDEEGLEIPEALVFRGQFFRESGQEAVGRFLSSGLPFDAVVCLNDYMAMGAIEELRARGLSVPAQVAVTGFDDVIEARWAPSPLTTVRQPIERYGIDAVDIAMDLLDKGESQSRSLACECVYRRSCGCPPILPLSESALFGEDGRADPELVERFREAASSNDAGTFLGALDAALPVEGGDMSDTESFARLRRALHLARRGMDGEASSERGLGAAANCFEQAFAFLDQAELAREVQRSIKADERHYGLRHLSSMLLASFSTGALARNWEDSLRALGYKRGFLVLFVPPVERGGIIVPPRSILVSTTTEPGYGVRRQEFDTALLLPPELGISWGKAGLLLEPLVYDDEALGYIILECGSEEMKMYETLRVEMSTAVKTTLLMDEIRENERNLEMLVEQRTRELREANEDLLSQIERRRKLEMEVQEISNRTMQSIGQDIHDDLCQHLAGVSMLAAVMEESQAATGSVSIDAIREIRELLASAVSRSRQFARTLYPPALDELGFVSALEDLVETLGRSAVGVSLSFLKEGDFRLEDSVKALQLYRIVQEALSNALKHSGSDVVILRLVKREHLLVAEIRDFGKGMGSDGDSRGMGLRIMRYRAESIGARLEINNLEPGVCISCSLDA